jgi:oligopeptide/dipeptide ABC transporter ATP-binding protein
MASQLANNPLISVRDAEFSYPRVSRPAVTGASLDVTEGAAIGIVGESGSGKSTLARLLVGLLSPGSGVVHVSGRPWSEVSGTDPARRGVQMIFQDPYASLNPRLSALETVAEVFRVWDGASRQSARTQAGSLLAEVGLPPENFDNVPARLSGGQCQRVSIARALACGPSVLVADEPTSALDVSIQAQILNLILGMIATHNMAIVLISHDLSVVRYVSDYSVVMYQGRIVERGRTGDLFDSPQHPYTSVLVDSAPGRSGGAHMVRTRWSTQSGCVFAARCARAQAKCAARPPEYVEAGHTEVACYFPLSTPATLDQPRDYLSAES